MKQVEYEDEAEKLLEEEKLKAYLRIVRGRLAKKIRDLRKKYKSLKLDD